MKIQLRVCRLATSFGQDFVYAVTHGKEKPPKHILLPFAVKSLTGNVELIHTLNRLGHSVSYSTAEEIDTALCLEKLALKEGDVALPSNINPGVFTTQAWDNVDRLEEQRSINTEPVILPTYNVGQQVGPPETQIVDVNSAKEKNLVWILARISSRNPKQSIVVLALTSSAAIMSQSFKTRLVSYQQSVPLQHRFLP